MAHFAKIDENNIVTQVIVAEQEFIDDQEGTWIQTSYNTYGGQHTLGGVPLRMNFTGIGYTYDPVRDAFIPPKPTEDAVFNEETCTWVINRPSPLEYLEGAN